MNSVCILIYVSMYLYSYQSTDGISGLAAGGAWEELTIKWTQRFIPMLWLSELGDSIGYRDWVNSEMHWEAVIKQGWRCNWRPRLCELRDTLQGRDRSSTRSMGGAPGAETPFIGLLTRNRVNVTSWLYLWSSYGKLAGCSRLVGRYAGSWSYI